jgi:hypothetical protein
MTNFIKKLNKEEMRLFKKSFSLPSFSYKLFFNLFNHKGIEEKLLIVEDNYIRKSYFGGRCEIFGNMGENEIIKYYDFSGMYSQCMEEDFHIGKGCFTNKDSIENIGFHTIEYESRDMGIPILPSRNNDNKLIFANFSKNVGTY